MKPIIKRAKLSWSTTLAFGVLSLVSIAIAKEPSEIELPNEHAFLKVRNVVIKEKEGRTAVNGSVFKIRDKFMPWGTHLHIDLIDLVTNDEDEEEEVVIERVLYMFRRRDFDDGDRFERFFKYVDLTDPSIDKIMIEVFTQMHSETCGEEEEMASGK